MLQNKIRLIAAIGLLFFSTPIALSFEPSLEPRSSTEDLIEKRRRANSDDAITITECFFHSNSRAQIISNLEPNKLGVGGAEFRTKRNPVGEGCFVYDPRTRFNGVERLLVWYVLSENKAYALNGPSKMLTPSLKWPREDGIEYPTTYEIADYVFAGKPIAKRIRNVPERGEMAFTVEEYEIYRMICDWPTSLPETDAYRAAAKKYSIEASKAKEIATRVQKVLFDNA